MRIPVFSGKGAFLAVCLAGKISRKTPEKGVFLNKSPEIFFSEAFEEMKKGV